MLSFKLVKILYIYIALLFLSLPVHSENLKLIKVVDRLDNPWGITFVDKYKVLITEKAGKIIQLNLGNGSKQTLHHNLSVLEDGQGGLLDILYEYGKVYVSFSEDRGAGKSSTSIAISHFEYESLNFKTVFRSLFTEDDDCDLLIVDENNPLESSIEIMAKPKGKKPLTINQLSGGEKTLTATSLLFAIYLLKPAPFCIFDEVDAPLDDANIDKFNKIINKFSNSSQFIIVTHNKRTMINTDIIYGITMPEQGVSKVVPVDLRNLKN